MRKTLGVAAVVLGVVGVLLCTAAIGVGWWGAVQTADRIVRVAARLDQTLTAAGERLGRVEARLNAARSELNKVREAFEAAAADDPELPRVRAKIEQILDRLRPVLDRVDTIADSLQSVAAGLRTAAVIVDQLPGDHDASIRIHNSADTIDSAAEALDRLLARVEDVKSAAAARLVRELVTLARDSAANSERLAEGLAVARQEIVAARERMAERRDRATFWVYVAASANTIVWVWGGLGQMCLIGWGRRRFAGPVVPG